MNDRSTLSRRAWIVSMGRALTAGLALMTVLPEDALAAPATKLTVYKDPSCGCCTKWVAHLRANGFTPEVHDRSDMDALKDTLGVPAALRSCHTAVAGKYVVEGHVPASDIKRLLTTRPKDVIGIAVPDMPAGSPGMEVAGQADRYDVIAFSATGTTRTFGKH